MVTPVSIRGNATSNSILFFNRAERGYAGNSKFKKRNNSVFPEACYLNNNSIVKWYLANIKPFLYFKESSLRLSYVLCYE